MQEDECQKVLQELADRGEVLDSTGVKIQIPADMASQKKFCKEKIYCEKTGKRVGTFGISWNNPKACAETAQRYANLKKIHGNTATAPTTVEPDAVGGRKKTKTTRRTRRTRRRKSTTKKRTRRKTGTARTRKQKKKYRKRKTRTRKYKKRK